MSQRSEKRLSARIQTGKHDDSFPRKRPQPAERLLNSCHTDLRSLITLGFLLSRKMTSWHLNASQRSKGSTETWTCSKCAKNPSVESWFEVAVTLNRSQEVATATLTFDRSQHFVLESGWKCGQSLSLVDKEPP